MKILIAAFGFSLALLLSACGTTTKFPFAREEVQLYSGTVETREIRVGSKTGGRVLAVLAEEGRLVKAGDPLVKLDVADLETQRAQAEARIAQQQARVALLVNGPRTEERAQAQAAAETARANLDAIRNWPRPEEIEQARAALAAAEADASSANTAFHRVERLRATGDAPQQEFEAAKYRREASQARRDAERKRLDLLLNGSRKEDIRAAEERLRQAQAAERLVQAGARTEEITAARAQLAEAQARLKQIEVGLAEGQVVAPADARVEIISVRPGDLLNPNQAVARLLELEQIFVRIYVPEPQLASIRVGQKATLKLDSNETVPGVIEQINTQGEFTPRNVQSRNERNHLVFGVKIRINNRDGKVKPGMAADVTLEK